MMVRKTIDVGRKLTEKEKKQLDELANMKDQDIVFDEDCPELTEEELSHFKRVSEFNKENRRKQTISLRLSPAAIRNARALGRGYTSVLSRVLEHVLSDAETLKKFL